MYKLPSLIFFSIRTEMDRDGLGGATSHMAIAQASLAHSGIYTCFADNGWGSPASAKVGG